MVVQPQYGYSCVRKDVYKRQAENYGAIYDEILRMKPASAKGRYVKSVTVVSTMGPGVPVDSSVNRNYTEAQ